MITQATRLILSESAAILKAWALAFAVLGASFCLCVIALDPITDPGLSHVYLQPLLATVLAFLTAGFAQGVTVEASFGAAAVGWFLVGLAASFTFLPLFSPSGVLPGLVMLPAAALLGFRRGTLYACTKRRRHILWLLIVLTAIPLATAQVGWFWDVLPLSVQRSMLSR